MKVNSVQAKEALLRCFQVGLTCMLAGSPGIGKSNIIANIAKERNLELIDIRLSTYDPADLNY